MKSTRAVSVEDFRLLTTFEEVRQDLQSEHLQDRLEKPLGFWALPKDRRLPWAFLDRPVNDLLRTPFDELLSTPGVGPKKMQSMVNLLKRVVKDDSDASPLTNGTNGAHAAAAKRNGARQSLNGSGFNPDEVSEALWTRWRTVVQRANLGNEPLGRLAPSLLPLPTVIWQTPLSYFIDRTLADMRAMKTYGEKRVAAVLEVFYSLQHTLAGDHGDNHLCVRRIEFAPRFVEEIERWLDSVKEAGVKNSVEEAEVREHLVQPLLEQIQTDLGEDVYTLVSQRLGQEGDVVSVRKQSQQLGVTRARIYQLYDECALVMEVRWPEGKARMDQFLRSMKRTKEVEPTRKLVQTLCGLLFPDKTVAKTINGHAKARAI